MQLATKSILLSFHARAVLLASVLAFSGLVVSCLQAADAVPAEANTVLVLGDSLAAGYGLDPGQAYPAVLQQKIKEAGWNFVVINAGVSGDTSAGGLRRLDWVLKRKV